MNWRCLCGLHLWALDLTRSQIRLQCVECQQVSTGWHWQITSPTARVLRFRQRIRTTTKPMLRAVEGRVHSDSSSPPQRRARGDQ
jgi:hypothetical protein